MVLSAYQYPTLHSNQNAAFAIKLRPSYAHRTAYGPKGPPPAHGCAHAFTT